MTSSDAPSPPGGPLRDDEPDGPLQPSGGEHGARPDPDDSAAEGADDAGPVPPIHHEAEQSEAAAALQAENAGTSLDQPSQ